MPSLEEEIALLASQNNSDTKPERWNFYQDLGPHLHWISRHGYCWYAEVDKLIREAPVAICLISPYAYVRECKIYGKKASKMNLEQLYDAYLDLEFKRNIDGNIKKVLRDVRMEGRYIKWINNPSEAICLAAVKRNGWAIKNINNPSEAVCLAAVKQDGYSLQYINNPSEAVCLAAIKQERHALQYVPQYIFDNMIKNLPTVLRLISPSKNIRSM